MSKTTLILAAGFAVALTAAPAFAQNGPSYEDRGYGGPLYVGPNFHEGGQYTHPIYGSGSYHNPFQVNLARCLRASPVSVSAA